MVRLARAFDRREADERERAFCRIATAIAKYWLCKRVPVHVGEALECLGGNGYVEESIMPRLYREAPLYSIWEGSGNVMCLDVLRALTKDPATVEALLAELQSTAGADQRLDAFVESIGDRLSRGCRRQIRSQRPDGKTCAGASGFSRCCVTALRRWRRRLSLRGWQGSMDMLLGRLPAKSM